MTLEDQHELFKRKYGEDYLTRFQPGLIDDLLEVLVLVIILLIFSPFLIAMLIYRLIWGKLG